LRQAYDYWQDQPGFSLPAAPSLSLDPVLSEKHCSAQQTTTRIEERNCTAGTKSGFSVKEKPQKAQNPRKYHM